ncbi:hypothetical protein PQQ51_21015 [Paraburkholderia xenovorans]|uniref:hypothetical protein n=1 Tax=Paraburkholderia xenovorans TaxID=36873 RepID=UPI0038B8E152
MDEQVPVFLYSIRRNSSFTLSSSRQVVFQHRLMTLEQPFACVNALSRRHYHFWVLKNEETLFLMMKALR